MQLQLRVGLPETESPKRIRHDPVPREALHESHAERSGFTAGHALSALASVFAILNQYDATTHFIGQSTIFTLTGDRATGEVYCIAHHVTVDGGKRRLWVVSIRYLDTCLKVDGAWLFAERLLYVDWMEERAMS